MQHLIIDGYNIIHSDPKLKALASQSLEASRDELIRLSTIIYENELINISIIFDGEGERACREVLRPHPLFEVIFSASAWSADSLIEQLSASAKHKGNIVAATQDRMIKETLASMNAQAINTHSFISWVERLSHYGREKHNRKKEALKEEWNQSLKKAWDRL